jgi:hypothetical protein
MRKKNNKRSLGEKAYLPTGPFFGAKPKKSAVPL